MRKMAKYLDFLLEKWMNPKKKITFNENFDEFSEEKEEGEEEEEIMIDYGEDSDQKKGSINYIQENRK